MATKRVIFSDSEKLSLDIRGVKHTTPQNDLSVRVKYHLYNSNEEKMGTLIRYSPDYVGHDYDSILSMDGIVAYLNEEEADKLEKRIKKIKEENERKIDKKDTQEFSDNQRCLACWGNGYVPSDDEEKDMEECSLCEGTGQVSKDICPKCGEEKRLVYDLYFGFSCEDCLEDFMSLFRRPYNSIDKEMGKDGL